MSAYSDYKCGAITEEEFKWLSRKETERDNEEDIPFFYDDDQGEDEE